MTIVETKFGLPPKADEPTTPPSTRSATPHFLSTIPHEFARRHLVLSTGNTGGIEHLRIAESTKPWIIHNVGVALNRPVQTEVASGEEVAAAIDAAYAASLSSSTDEIHVEASLDVGSDLSKALKDAESDLLSTQGKAPSVQLVDLILFEALLKGASDVHLQPVRGKTLVRYRLDGVLHTARELPRSIAASVASRVKVMARLDVAEQRAPQDGRAAVTIGSGHSARRIDLRVSSLPSTYGERIVLRLLDPSRSPHLRSFAALGMPAEIERKYLAQVGRTSGIVLSTGPTGSGKTTTLYATLAWLSATYDGAALASAKNKKVAWGGGCELNMMTIEDPVEYDLAGFTSGPDGKTRLSISQTQVDPKKNVTFAAGLRHILRQDPDVIMVGEVRDQETARIAVQASLTGHLVLSTLHTSDASGAIARLIDLSVEPFLVASSLSAVLAQRLVRTIHQGEQGCAGAGCEACLGSGYKGRTGVFELLVMDAPQRELVGRRASAADMKEQARSSGMITLREFGEDLIRRGITTNAEVSRVIEMVEVEV